MPTRQLQIFKCPVCEAVVEVLDPCGVELVCCGPRMIHMEARVASESRGAHAVRLQRSGSQVRVKIGVPAHTMDVDHHIQWVELITPGKCLRQFLKPGDIPEVLFNVSERPIAARFFCRVHGLWKSSFQDPGDVLEEETLAEASV
ncbi:MAG: desulfoferrodoxin family protein [Phycisphaerae bacterium]